MGARQAIYDLVRHQASAGVSFVVCSSDPDDLLAVCDRQHPALNEGRVVEQLVGADIEESRLLMAMVARAKCDPRRSEVRTDRGMTHGRNRVCECQRVGRRASGTT